MKITTFACLFVGLHLSLLASSQTRFSFTVAKQPLFAVLHLIEQKSDYRFFYKESRIFSDKEITLKVKGASLDDVLSMVLNGTGLNYTVNEKHLVVIGENETAAETPPRQITGVVWSERHEPLSHVSVLVKGSSRGTQTDEEGRFSIQADESDSLVFSYIGYETQTVRAGASLRITLRSSSQQINTDVVVVGYSDKKKNELTSAVSVVSAEKLKDVTTNDIGSMLQGKVAGLQVVSSSGAPGSAAELRLRGVSSVNASQSPLIVVDGIIGGNYDPNDVETITVLKDAGATAMYGSQANAGVIIVTTKKAAAGKIRFEAKFTTGFRTPDFGKMQMMSGSQLYDHTQQYYRDYIPGDTSNSYKIDLIRFINDYPRTLRNQNNNWLTGMFKRAPANNVYVSASGRTDKNDYYLGMTYYDEKGTFLNSDYHRINVRANTTHHFAPLISLTNDINLSGTIGKSYDYNDVYYAYLNMPWDNPYDSTGKPLYVDGNSSFKWW